METFQLLSGGGVRFNKTKYEKDVSLFTVCLSCDRHVLSN